MKKFLALLAISAISFSACTGTEETTTSEETEETAEEEVIEEISETGPFFIDEFALAETGTTAEAGEMALAPTSQSLYTELTEEGDGVYLSYDAVEVIEAGEKSSTVQDSWKSSDPYVVDNNLIIPLKGGDVAPGDTILTYHQSLGSMIRARVVSNDGSIQASYLDDFWQETVEIPENAYALVEEGGVGSIVACDNGYDAFDTLWVVADAGNDYLMSGWAERTYTVAKSSCASLPLDPGPLAEGDTVYAPPIGELRAVTVLSVDTETGIVEGEYEWAGEMSTGTFPFGEITKEAPSL